MKKNVIVSFLIFSSLISFAQFSFKTGSQELDANLNEMNTYAKVDFGAFKTELSASFNVKEQKINFLRTSVKMEPAEIYFALELSRLSHKSIDQVVEVYKVNRDKGWGYVAKQLGIKPGSSEFHQLKERTKSKGAQGKAKGKDKGRGKRK